ncbi:MAG: hypothetical protein NT121_20870, partial [Chloroflexi bacterium]|nr:hypothetical protein [Chloroflexota bacterium]
PLPLGHAHQENVPTIENGIYFGEYLEGKPGVQPERLGPYCTTLNPGYDPSLQLYAPNPMYAAIRAAFSPEGSLPSPYETEQVSPAQKALTTIDSSEPVTFLGAAVSVHYQGLKAAGVQFHGKGAIRFIYADLESISFIQKWCLKIKLNALKKSGGTILLSGVIPASQRFLENLLGEKVEIFAREASSLVFAGEYAATDPIVDHFRLGELYFSEDEDSIIQRYGVSLENPEKSTALLKSCSCDWRMWNHHAEASKTAALCRSEKESSAAIALVKLNIGKASILLSTIEMRENRALSERGRKNLWNKLMKAAGARIDDNFGKDARFSTYTQVREILKNPQAKAIAQRFIPMVGMLTDEMIAEISSFNIRELAKLHGRLLLLSSKKLDQIDQALGEIPLGVENSVSSESDGFDENTRALQGDQIVRALVAGFFAGSDCASMLNEDFLGGENNADPVPGDEIVQNAFSTIWQVQTAGLDGFHLKEMAFNGTKENSTCYMSFYLNSPRQLESLLIEPNVPKLYLNVETGCCIRVWVNGKEIFTQREISAKPINSQIPLLLHKGNNHILVKVVNTDTECAVKASLSSSHVNFVEKLTGAVAQ